VEAAVARQSGAAKDFLARNGHEKRRHDHDLGLEYKVICGEPQGCRSCSTDAVTVQYRANCSMLEFDSSYAPRTPASFHGERRDPRVAGGVGAE